MSDYKENIGAAQKDIAGADYYINIGADQTDEFVDPCRYNLFDLQLDMNRGN